MLDTAIRVAIIALMSGALYTALYGLCTLRGQNAKAK